MNENAKKKIKRSVLKIIRSVSEEVLTFFQEWESYGEFAQRMYGLPYRQKELSKKQIYESVRRIKKQGWLEQKKINDQIFYRLSKEGRIKKLLTMINHRPFKKAKMSTIVIFDIPEEKRTFRNFLRRLLIQMEFTMVQKSVFIAVYVLPKEFYDLLNEMKLLPYVRIIEGKLL